MVAALLVLAAALIALEAAGRWVPPDISRRVGAGLCLLGSLIAFASVATDSDARLEFAAMQARLDGLSGWMAMALLLPAGCGLLTGEREASRVGLALLTLVAGGAALLVLGLAGLVATSRPRRVTLPIWAGCAALAVLGLALHAGPAFEAMRAAPPEGLLATVTFLLVVAGVAALFGAVLRGEAPAWLTWLGVAVATRITLDLCGPATPVWWGALLAACGLATATLSGWLACMRSSTAPILAAAAVSAAGLACAGLGIALAARGADLPSLAAQGLETALLLVLAQAASVALLGLASEMGRHGLGLAVSCVAAGSLAALPPFAGFTGLWLLLHALFAACRIGGAWLEIGCAFAVAAVGLALGLTLVALVRALGFGFLRRATVSAASSLDLRVGMAVLGAVSLLLAIGPGVALLGAAPMLQAFVSAEPAEDLLFVPVVITAALAVACAAGVWFTRAGPERRRVAAWNGGAPADSVLHSYAPQRLALRLPRIEPRAPTVRECLGTAVVALAVGIIVLASR